MNKKYLHMAAKLAAKGDSNKNYLHGCIGIRSDGAIVKADNSLTREPVPSSHAEFRVCKKLDKGSVIYVARILRANNEWANSKPCPTCSAYIKNSCVKAVYYTISHNEYGVWHL